MNDKQLINVFWFRRDLRLYDNTGLDAALKDHLPVLPLFIFDENIISDLTVTDARISFIYDSLAAVNKELTKLGSSLCVKKGEPGEIFEELSESYKIQTVFANRDYEPYAIERDQKVSSLLKKKGTGFLSFKDQVIFEEKEILNSEGKAFTVFTSYKNRWIEKYSQVIKPLSSGRPRNNFIKSSFRFPSLKETGFEKSDIRVKKYDLSCIEDYDKFRDYPAEDKTTRLGPYLRFGTVSIRYIAQIAAERNRVFLGELIWREFFMQIIYNFPGVVTNNFRARYNNIIWRNNESEFLKWCKGETGYRLVDAGMRQMNETGYMHNRVRMVVASFLCKHLLTDWRFGEAYFAEKLNDYELSSNNGNWQWAAGTGCDAAPYFRIFNPEIQAMKFDKDDVYTSRWLGAGYKVPQIVDHAPARERALQAYRSALQ